MFFRTAMAFIYLVGLTLHLLQVKVVFHLSHRILRERAEVLPREAEVVHINSVMGTWEWLYQSFLWLSRDPHPCCT